jgi:ubiquinone/menaquinone biosynthesis C-methylase UbiE
MKKSQSQAWSLYWQSGNLDSCIALNSNDNQQLLANIWMTFSASLDDNIHLLDLATGNGTVPVMLLSHHKKIKVTGVDYADISPQHYVKNNTLLKKVNFLANTDICKLPFQADYFDAVTSQFGFEYADVEKASAELIRVLKPNAKFQLIIHHAQSEVVKPARHKVWEFSLLLEKNGLIEQLKAFISGNSKIDELEKFGQSFLKKYSGQLTRAISGQIFLHIDHILSLVENKKYSGNITQMVDDLILRMRAEYSRLQQLISVAFDLSAIERLKNLMKAQLYQVNYYPITIPENNSSVNQDILAWCFYGQK